MVRSPHSYRCASTWTSRREKAVNPTASLARKPIRLVDPAAGAPHGVQVRDKCSSSWAGAVINWDAASR